METHRGTVQKGTCQTLTCQGGENVGVVVDEELEEYIEHYKNDSQKPEGYQILFDEYVRRQEAKKNNTEK